MTKHHLTQSSLLNAAQRAPDTLLDRPLKRLLNLVHEWRARRSIVRSLGQLSSFYLRDIGLTKADVEAACADSLNRSASRSLGRAAQGRTETW